MWDVAFALKIEKKTKKKMIQAAELQFSQDIKVTFNIKSPVLNIKV